MTIGCSECLALELLTSFMSEASLAFDEQSGSFGGEPVSDTGQEIVTVAVRDASNGRRLTKPCG